MSVNGWDDLERVWQSLPPQAAPVVEELQRQERWRWLSAAFVQTEIATAVGGTFAGLWLLARGDMLSVIVGIATLIFTAAVSAASYWARSLAPVRAEDAVMRAVATAVRRARVGVRLGVAALWSVCASLVFLAVFAFALMLDGPPRDDAYAVFGAALVWLAVWLGGTIYYLRARTADLARLEAIEAELSEEDLMSGSGVR